MSKHYDNWERVVAAVLRREHDHELALCNSRDNTSMSSSSYSCYRSSTTTNSLPDHDHSLDLRDVRGADPLPIIYSNQNPIREEEQWLREEQRWLREERRWLREESRWNSERQGFLQEINRLKLRVRDLERFSSLHSQEATSGSDTNIVKFLQILKGGDLWSSVNMRNGDGETSVVPLAVGEAKEEEEVFVKEMISDPETKQTVTGMATLIKGSVHDEIRAMQSANESAITTVKDMNDIPHTFIREEDVPEFEVSQQKVFLGENQQKEPSRLHGGSKRATAKTTIEIATTKCFLCR